MIEHQPDPVAKIHHIKCQDKQKSNIVAHIKYNVTDQKYRIAEPTYLFDTSSKMQPKIHWGIYIIKNCILQWQLCLKERLSPFTTNPSDQLYIPGHDGNSLSMNSAQVGIFEETDQVGLNSK